MSTNTGGPAFPRSMGETRSRETNLPIYDRGTEGMTLRDYFAAKATGADIEPYWVAPRNREAAKYAYADAMLKARQE